tara:strand:- start:541 stop:720 length:180 start_codon:yes stop_codon:yes gene_type:complete
MTKVSPALLANINCGSEIDVLVLKLGGSHLRPPVFESGMPIFQCALKTAVLCQIYVIGY